MSVKLRETLSIIYQKYFDKVSRCTNFNLNKNNRLLFKEIQKEYDSFFKKSSEMHLLFMEWGIEKFEDNMFCYCGNRKNVVLKNCSRLCASNNPDYFESCKKTKIDRYGDPNFNNIKQALKTRVDRYGENYAAPIEKGKKTCLERYGVENVFQSPDIIERCRETRREKYDDENYNNPEKGRETRLRKYGDENYNNREKFKSTCLERYGVENVFQSDDIKKQIREANYKDYGAEYPAQKHIENVDNMNEEFIKKNFIVDNRFLLDDFCDYFNVRKCIYYSKYKELYNISEPVKTCKHRTQDEIFDWLVSLNVNVEMNDKTTIKPLEIDILIPEHKLAIEYDGLIYHSFGKNEWSPLNNYHIESESKHKHLQKTELCEKEGYQLLHIFENEWLDDTKQNIWKSMIKSRLSLNDKIFARKCVIKEVDFKTTRSFLNKNHLQDSISSSIQIGLYFNDELVSLMTFSESRYDKRYQYEILRFCNKCHVNVIGGFSKLLKYFKKVYNCESIISYANRRWSRGDVYHKNNFNLMRITKPNYFYFQLNNLNLYSRQMFQKHKLSIKLDQFDECLTETENMYNNKYRKIYDCGSLCFIT